MEELLQMDKVQVWWMDLGTVLLVLRNWDHFLH